MKVAVLGLGIMGQVVARTLMRDGLDDVAAWNRTPAKARPFADEGAAVAEGAAKAVAGSDADSIADVLDEACMVGARGCGLDPGLERRPRQDTVRIVELAEKHGATLIEAMTLGTKTPAEADKLVMLAAGDKATIEKVQPVLDSMGQKTVVPRPTVGNGTALNLFLQAIDGGASDSPHAHQKGASMTPGESPAFVPARRPPGRRRLARHRRRYGP